MENDIRKVKVTVLKKMENRELADEYLSESAEGYPPCPRVNVGQEFIFENPFGEMAEGFCPWAYADLRHYITALVGGGDIPKYFKQKGVMVAHCSDVFMPVIFKLEIIEE